MLSPRVSRSFSFWIVSTRPFNSKSANHCTNLLVIVPRASNTTDLSITFMLHNFFSSVARSRYLSFFSLSFSFTYGKVHISASFLSFFFFFCLSLVLSWLRLGDPFVSQNPREFCASPFLGQMLGCVYTICSYN